MHITNLPLIGTSVLFLLPFYAAVETQNTYSTLCWGALTCTSTLVHITKQPYHIHGPGNVIPWLYAMDVVALYSVAVRCMIDGWYGGVLGMTMTTFVITYAIIFFYAGQRWSLFVYDKHLAMSLMSHASTHMLTALGGVGLLYLRAFKNGLPDSQ